MILANTDPIDSSILAPAVCSYILPLIKNVVFSQVSKISLSKDCLENQVKISLSVKI